MSRFSSTLIAVFIVFLLRPEPAAAVPYFARKYDVTCTRCHLLPPTLNEFGLRFAANGYKLPELVRSRTTLPIAVWLTQRFEVNESNGRAKGFPNRVELISADAVTPWLSYFVEWRPLSYQTTGNQRLLGRHGRFEDVFLQFWLPKRTVVTVGQFRMLNQWDVSRRLHLSEPQAFSAGVGGRSSRNARLASLRSFSLSGRAPAVRATFQTFSGGSLANGWFHELVLPFSGELTLPLGAEARRNASFEIEGRAKGLLYETYYRQGLSSIGGSVFAGGDRWLSNLTGVWQKGDHGLLATVGTAKFRNGLQDFRLSVGDTYFATPWLAFGARLDQQSSDRIGPAVLPHVSFSFPNSKYTYLFTIEQRIQRGRHTTLFEVGAVF